MSKIRDNFINAVKSLPYDINEVAINKNTIEILRDVTEKYVEMYGTEDLIDKDKECIKAILESNKIERK